MPRIFFAVEVPENIRTELVALQERLTVAPEDMKLVEKQNLHLTLHFVGDVTEARLRQILQGAEVAAACCLKYKCEIRAVGAFPTHQQARVLWAGVRTGKEHVIELARSLSMALGVIPEKPFKPHLTIGRFREGRYANMTAFLEKEKSFRAGIFTIDHFTCFESTLTPKGPVYKKIKEIFLP